MLARSPSERTPYTTQPGEILHHYASHPIPDVPTNHHEQRNECRRFLAASPHASHLQSVLQPPCQQAHRPVHEPHPIRRHTLRRAELLQCVRAQEHQGWCCAYRDANDASECRCELQFLASTAAHDQPRDHRQGEESAMQQLLLSSAQQPTTRRCA